MKKMLNKLMTSRPESLKVWLLIIFFGILFTIPLWVSDPAILTIFIYTFLNAFYGASWSIIGKYGGQISLGHAVCFGLGAYISVWLNQYYDISLWLGMFAGGAVAALTMFLIGLVSFRLRGLFFILTTLAFAEVVRVILNYPLNPLTNGDEGIALFRLQFMEKWPYYFIALAMMLLIMIILHRIEKSKLGYYLAAIREDQEAAESIGINPVKYKSIALVISGFLSALAGTFYVHLLGWIGVSDVLGIMRSIEPIIISWVGGAGVFGPIVGSFIITPVSMFLALSLGGAVRGLNHIIYALILIFIVMFMPEGVTGVLSRKVYHPLRKRLKTIS